MSAAALLLATVLLARPPDGPRPLPPSAAAPPAARGPIRGAAVPVRAVAYPAEAAVPGASRPGPWTLAELEQLALERHPALALAAAHVDAAHGRWIQAGRHPNPVVGYAAEEIGDDNTAGKQGAFVSQRVVTGGKRHLEMAVAAQQIDEARFAFAAAQQRVLGDVRRRYYETLAAQRREEITHRIAELGEELAAATARLLQARQVSENDLLSAEIEAESAQLVRERAGIEAAEAWRRLAVVTGLPVQSPAPLAGNLEDRWPQIDWESRRAALLGQSPELGAAWARVAQARYALARQCRQWIPDVDLAVSVQHDNGSRDNVAGVQVGIPLPLFDANQGAIQQARAELAAAEAAVAQLEWSLVDRLATAFGRYEAARIEAERYRERILPRAERSLELVSQGYQQGQVDYLSLLTAQRTYLQANLAYLDALRELWDAAAWIEGMLLGESLAASSTR